VKTCFFQKLISLQAVIEHPQKLTINYTLLMTVARNGEEIATLNVVMTTALKEVEISLTTDINVVKTFLTAIVDDEAIQSFQLVP
jgi:CRISPR/Cas system CSM-associated protein Csm2 small subunit